MNIRESFPGDVDKYVMYKPYSTVVISSNSALKFSSLKSSIVASFAIYQVNWRTSSSCAFDYSSLFLA